MENIQTDRQEKDTQYLPWEDKNSAYTSSDSDKPSGSLGSGIIKS